MMVLGDFMNQSIIFLVFVAVAELVFIIQHNYQASITLLILTGLFSGLFFLSQYRKGIKSFITSFAERWKPPHQRVKSITVGNSENTDDTIVRIEKQNKKIPNAESSRNHNRNSNSSQTNTACVIPVAISNNRSD